MRDPKRDPAVRRRLAMVRYARSHSKAEAARHYGCCWRTIQAAVQRVERYEQTGHTDELQNLPRGKPGRTAEQTEERVVAIYKESWEPARPKGRRYAAAKVARLLDERYGTSIHRKTAWAILCRRGVWQADETEKTAVQRFERQMPNDLWQIDLIELEPTSIGYVYGVPILDDYSRYLTGLRFFLTKGAETTLLTTYLTIQACGTPCEMLCDRGGQFVDAAGQGRTKFQDVLDALGIQLRIAHRAQTKGKEERLNQFVERDFLDEVRWQVHSLEELNQRAEAWRETYNQFHQHEETHTTPARRYRPGLKVDETFLRQLFATEERRKVTREATVRFQNRHFKVPDKYIGYSVWVANFLDQYIEIRSGTRILGRFEL